MSNKKYSSGTNRIAEITSRMTDEGQYTLFIATPDNQDTTQNAESVRALLASASKAGLHAEAINNTRGVRVDIAGDIIAEPAANRLTTFINAIDDSYISSSSKQAIIAKDSARIQRRHSQQHVAQHFADDEPIKEFILGQLKQATTGPITQGDIDFTDDLSAAIHNEPVAFEHVMMAALRGLDFYTATHEQDGDKAFITTKPVIEAIKEWARAYKQDHIVNVLNNQMVQTAFVGIDLRIRFDLLETGYIRVMNDDAPGDRTLHAIAVSRRNLHRITEVPSLDIQLEAMEAMIRHHNAGQYKSMDIADNGSIADLSRRMELFDAKRTRKIGNRAERLVAALQDTPDNPELADMITAAQQVLYDAEEIAAIQSTKRVNIPDSEISGTSGEAATQATTCPAPPTLPN